MRVGKGGWLVVVFCLAAVFIYVRSMKEKKMALSEYAFRLEEMQKERLLACAERDELHLRIASQTDPAWIEMVLMRDLGVVPQGWMKVHFRSEAQ